MSRYMQTQQAISVVTAQLDRLNAKIDELETKIEAAISRCQEIIVKSNRSEDDIIHIQEALQ